MSHPWNGENGSSVPVTPNGPYLTGRYLVLFADNVRTDESAMMSALSSAPGVSNVISTSDFADNALDAEQAEGADAQLFPNLGAAVVSPGAGGMASLADTADQDNRVEAIEPEQRMFALTTPLDYVRGFHDAVDDLYAVINGRAAHNGGPAAPASAPVAIAAPAAVTQFVDTPAFTWGLQATGVTTSRADGRGVRVAMLDTGFDLHHPDFTGRAIVSASFVQGQSPQDGQGHGTHVTGTSSGPAKPSAGTRRYGCAPLDDIYIGKVLSNQGSGTDGQILAGIDWAIANECRVISMSLGADVATPSALYTKIGQRALAAQCLIIAAAGNNRQRLPGSVGRPANSPSIMAVGAVDANLQLAPFSATSGTGQGGGVDIAGPGVAVFSSWPVTNPRGGGPYRVIQGTSMATPHVAGIAALWCQATGATGMALWGQLTRTAKRLPLPSADVGCGLVQAP